MSLKRMITIFQDFSWVKVIAITGGPCGGKSTFLKMAVNLLEKHGFRVILVPESARELISSGIRPWDTAWKDGLGFQRAVFLSALRKEVAFFETLQNLRISKDKPVVFLCDRGLVDGMAYCGEASFKQMLTEFGLNLSEVLDRYHGCLHLVTAAIGAPEFYKNDDERHETPEQAALLDLETSRAWHQHQHFFLIDNSTSFSDKINRALSALKRILPMPKNATEIESKNRVLNFSIDRIPEGTKFYDIVQNYLDIPDKPDIECRIRAKIIDGKSTYFYTEKTATSVEGERGEHEEIIDEARYNELFSTYLHLSCQTIRKRRYKIPFVDKLMELDVYQEELEGLVVCEVECQSIDELRALVLPAMFEYEDVTSDPRYSNRQLAEFGIPD